MDFFLQLLAQGIVIGLVYALVGQGLNVTFWTIRVVNFAHGALYAMGGYALIAVMHAGGAGYWLALVAAPLLVIPIAIVLVHMLPLRYKFS